MKFPLCAISSVSDASKIKEMEYNQITGRIYLIEVNGYVKIGRTNNIAKRAQQHRQSSNVYCFPVGRIAYSDLMSSVAKTEASFHHAMESFRVPGCRELYSASLEDLIAAFDVDWEPARLQDIESEKADRERRQEEYRLNIELQRRKRAESKRRNDLILEAAKKIIENGGK